MCVLASILSFLIAPPAFASAPGGETETIGLGTTLAIGAFLAIAVLVVASIVCKLLIVAGLVPERRSYPSVSGYEQHEVGTRVDASTQSERARSATTRPNSTSPSTGSPNRRSRAFEVAKVSIRPGVLQEYRVLGPILGTFRNVTRPCQTSVHETRSPDERSDLRGDSRTAGSVPAALPGPEELEAGPLPSDHGSGLDDGDGIRPAVPQAG
jgi:hypothetical protein